MSTTLMLFAVLSLIFNPMVLFVPPSKDTRWLALRVRRVVSRLLCSVSLVVVAFVGRAGFGGDDHGLHPKAGADLPQATCVVADWSA